MADRFYLCGNLLEIAMWIALLIPRKSVWCLGWHRLPPRPVRDTVVQGIVNEVAKPIIGADFCHVSGSIVGVRDRCFQSDWDTKMGISCCQHFIKRRISCFPNLIGGRERVYKRKFHQ